jgi:hypothetical protein
MISESPKLRVVGHSNSIYRSSMKGVDVGTGAVRVAGGNSVGGGCVSGTVGRIVGLVGIPAAQAARVRRTMPNPINRSSFQIFLMSPPPGAQTASLEGHIEAAHVEGHLEMRSEG